MTSTDEEVGGGLQSCTPPPSFIHSFPLDPFCHENSLFSFISFSHTFLSLSTQTHCILSPRVCGQSSSLPGMLCVLRVALHVTSVSGGNVSRKEQRTRMRQGLCKMSTRPRFLGFNTFSGPERDDSGL